MTNKRRINKSFNEDKYLENKLKKLHRNKKQSHIRDTVDRYLYTNNKDIPDSDRILYKSSDI